ncbi:MAG TPA: gluconeogenesis factor YvcK family protein [Candidatus Acidoferrum sp.]|nr:gluconeogenesis factor YvcK family protein [Candidatus Acidoferrum sp.]
MLHLLVKKKLHKPKPLPHGFRVVALGGGTGLSTLLRGLKEYVVRRSDEHPNSLRPISDLTAIVTVTDDGGSSGRLRRENRILPPGDIRNCMVALSKDEALMGRLFQYRFHAGRGLAGHNFGNLFLAALTHVTGDFAEAVSFSSKVLAIRGRIFPSTLSNVHLEARLTDGRIIHGETKITASRTPIEKVKLSSRHVPPFPAVLEAIQEADLILLGPGSLYTSILPNLLIPEIAAAIAKSSAPRVYIANLMTQPGETTSYSLADHLRAIRRHTPGNLVDWVIANRQAVSPEVAKRYRRQGAAPVNVDLHDLRKMGYRVILDNLLDEHGVIRHNSTRLARLLLEEFLSASHATQHTKR